MLNLLYCLSYKDHTLTHTYTHKQIQTFILIMVNKWKRLKKNARAKQCPYHTLTQSLKKCLRRDLKKFVVVHPFFKKRALFSARALCCVASDKVKSATKKKQTKEKEKQVIANKTRKTIVLLIVEERNLHKHTHRKHKQQTELS
uniref:(northern house mosquito) hypothetical protein n=1 Tax=Culex pipiens TaxID=7175 RepID=A0A8D8F720_CULPI